MTGSTRLSAPVSRTELEAAIRVPKAVLGRTVWNRKPNEAWAEARWKIRHELAGIELILIANMNLRAPEKHTVSVLWNEVRVAGICVQTPHRNKHTDENVFAGSDAHEHVWTDECNGSWCRELRPVPTAVKATIIQACEAFGVSFEAEWAEPPGDYQIGMVAL